MTKNCMSSIATLKRLHKYTLNVFKKKLITKKYLNNKF